jgi:hypothetical protein
VDDAGWTATFKFMADMNMKRGNFPDKVKWMNWVIRLTNVEPAERGGCGGGKIRVGRAGF